MTGSRWGVALTGCLLFAVVGCGVKGGSDSAPRETSTSTAPVATTTSTTIVEITTTTGETTSTTAATTTTQPLPYGGLAPALPSGAIGDFEYWEFPLPGPSTSLRPVEMSEGPYEEFDFMVRLDDRSVRREDVMAYITNVPLEHGWMMKREVRSAPMDGWDGVDWGFFNAEGLWVSINLFEAPEGDDAAPPDLLVTYTFTDGW